MNLLPFEQYEVRSSMSLNELHTAIDESCEPWKLSTIIDNVSYDMDGVENKTFFGGRKQNRFSLYRSTARKTVGAIAYGNISESNGEILVKITLRMHIVVMIFLFFWIFFALRMAFIVFSHGGVAPSLIPIAMGILGFLVVQSVFLYEAPKLKKLMGESFLKSEFDSL